MQFRLSALKRGVSRARARSREPERSPPQLLCVWGLRAACSSSAAGRGGGEATPAPGASGLPGTPRKPSPMAADVPAHMISQVQRAMMATIPGTHMMGTLMSFCEECCWDGTCAAAVLVFKLTSWPSSHCTAYIKRANGLQQARVVMRVVRSGEGTATHTAAAYRLQNEVIGLGAEGAPPIAFQCPAPEGPCLPARLPAGPALPERVQRRQLAYSRANNCATPASNLKRARTPYTDHKHLSKACRNACSTTRKTSRMHV